MNASCATKKRLKLKRAIGTIVRWSIHRANEANTPCDGRNPRRGRYSVIVLRAPAAEVATPTPSRTSAA